jgi:hypothetical protein
VLRSCRKITEAIGHQHPRSSPLPRVFTVPSASAILNAFWKSCSVRVFSTGCLDHLNCVKMAAFQLYLQSEKQRKVAWVGNDSHLVFGKKNSLVKREVWGGALSWYNSQSLCHQSSGRSLRTFSRNLRSHSSIQNWLFGLPGRILCEQSPLMSKKMMSMLLTLLFTCLVFFGLPWTAHAI